MDGTFLLFTPQVKHFLKCRREAKLVSVRCFTAGPTNGNRASAAAAGAAYAAAAVSNQPRPVRRTQPGSYTQMTLTLPSHDPVFSPQF